MQSFLCTAQVRGDVVSLGTISICHVQLGKQKLVYACRAAVRVVRYVYRSVPYLGTGALSGTPWKSLMMLVFCSQILTGSLS